MIVGLTGGIGSGKSTVCGMFKELGVPIISADEISHELLATDKSVQRSLLNHFSTEIQNNTEALDRDWLRTKILNSPEDKIWLEELLHPLIAEQITKRAKVITYPYCVVEIPLLLESNMQNIVDRILTVDCAPDLQLQRATRRGKQKSAEIEAFIAKQITREKRLAASNDILENNTDIKTLAKHVNQLHKQYLSFAT